VAKSALSFSTEVGRQILDRVQAGQSAEDMAKQLGRTPETIRAWLRIATVAGQKPAALLQQPALHERAVAFVSELVAFAVFMARSPIRGAGQSRDAQAVPDRVGQPPGAAAPGNLQEGCDGSYRFRSGRGRSGAETRRAKLRELAPRNGRSPSATWCITWQFRNTLAIDDRMATRINMGRLVAGRIPPNL